MPLLKIGSFFISHTVRFFTQLSRERSDLWASPLVIDTVNSSTSYVYDPRTRTYIQPEYASRTLQSFLTVNSELLQKLETLDDIPIEGRATVPKGTPLTNLIAVGAKSQNSAPAILSTLLETLGKQTEYVML